MASFDFTLPLMTAFRDNPDYDRLDEFAEIQSLLTRQDLVNKIFAGQASIDELLDCVNDQGFEVDDFIETVSQEIEFVQENDLARDMPEEDRLFLVGA